MIGRLAEYFFGPYLPALVIKETKEILRNKYLVFLLLVPPIIQLLILGAALDPQVRNLSLGLVDNSRTKDSRDLISAIRSSRIFAASGFFGNGSELTRQLENGKLDVGVVIPQDFTTHLNRDGQADVQVIVDGADAYSAKIASAYILRTIGHFRSRPLASTLIDPHIMILYNPGLLASWFFVPGVLGATLTLTATLVSSATILRERENGTMDQLLMTPAETEQIWIAKVIPLVVFLLCDVCLAIAVTRLVFGLPLRGSMALFLLSSGLYVFCAIGLGMLLGTLCHSQQQAQLTSFFINIPLIQLSGTVVPFDTMPRAMQMLAVLNPLKYYADIARRVILKGDGLDSLWPNLLVLTSLAVIVLALSINRFRRQTA